MNLAEHLDIRLDLGLARKLFLCFSAAMLFLVPVDGLRLHFKGAMDGKRGEFSRARLESAKAAAEPLASYLALFDKSTLFGAGTSSSGAPVVKASLAELVKDYRLKGVMLTDDPEAIVEDARTQKTQFLKVGSHLGDLTVKAIREGVLVLSYLGEEIKLEIQ